jgi:hypothetical protein
MYKRYLRYWLYRIGDGQGCHPGFCDAQQPSYLGRSLDVGYLLHVA